MKRLMPLTAGRSVLAVRPRRFSSPPPWVTRRNSSSIPTAMDNTGLVNLTQKYTISTTPAAPEKPHTRNNGWVIPPLYASTETFMAIPPLPKGRRRRPRPKRASPLPYHEIPRTLTHHPQEKSPYGVGNRYRGVYINHLAPGTTHADVTAGIAATAPVGPITSVTLLRPPPDQERAFGKLRAHVVFGRYQATRKLVKAAREDGVFKVNGTAVAGVSTDKSVAYHWNSARRIDSRVLLMRAKPGTPGFTESALRAAMEADEEAMQAAGPLGARSEPVVSYEVDEGDVTMEWRFFSHVQAMAMRRAVQRACGGRLAIYKGWDPCWVDEAKGQVPERLNREQAWRNAWGTG
ncbi:hypothetical protein N0V82_000077 [Gnomoniopsis sp. IMI 355080]|nr:hypothetical protein N0V82_000077 [Gnomoniopsis sp. IMI 355080]